MYESVVEMKGGDKPPGETSFLRQLHVAVNTPSNAGKVTWEFREGWLLNVILSVKPATLQGSCVYFTPVIDSPCLLCIILPLISLRNSPSKRDSFLFIGN